MDAVFFTCMQCNKIIGIVDDTILVAYKGHPYCMMCRKAAGHHCSSRPEDLALYFEEIRANGEVVKIG